MRLRWTRPAADEFERNQTFYENANRQAACVLSRRVNEAIRRLRDNPNLGRKGMRSGTHECVVQQTPYVIVYRVAADQALEILHVWHSRQDWTNFEGGG